MSTIGLADFERVRRAGLRTAALRIALLLGAVALFALAFLESRGTGSEVGALLPAGTSPIVVLDISASISGPTNTRVYTTLRTLADSNGNLRRANLAFRIVPLFPLGRDLALWTQLAGADAITAPATLPTDIKAARAQEAHPFRPGLPAGLLTLAAALVLLLAVNEQFCARLPIGRRSRW